VSRAWVLVTGDVGPRGGQDKANLALATHLARRGDEVHLVAHDVHRELASAPGVRVHRVPRPLGSHVIGGPALAAKGRAVAREVTARSPGARVVVNGGNCDWPDVNWVHLVHHAWRPGSKGASLASRARSVLVHRIDLARELRIVRAARLVFANSQRTRTDLVERLGVSPDRVVLQYLGADPEAFGPVSPDERQRARARLGAGDRPVLAFVGALGSDRRKGFDTLLAALGLLRDEELPRPLLLAAGGGALRPWRERIEALGLTGTVRLLGPIDGIPELLAASDLLVSPVRYEPYGLNVHEALCRGIPALVSACAGVAERYPDSMRALLLPDPDDAGDLARRLSAWWRDRDRCRGLAAALGAELRSFTWDHMAAQMVRTLEATA
jgi:glycosyltransferase involved in cell wall biosynthesis